VTGEELAAFVEAGRRLAASGLVRGGEGNLSTCDGRRLVITRTGCRLADLGPDDVLMGTLDAPPTDASSDLAIHVDEYRRRGAGALAHAHPPGTVPTGWVEGDAHGVYAFAPLLADAIDAIEAEYA
jgi:ribulose-5-phosphate 4-epimerase/fuculose-1-phosphate aldolase